MTTITNELPGFPQVSQLHSPTTDGMPDENASWNCVPASIAAGLNFLLGANYEPDTIKDLVYGQGYTGAQAASQYVGFCRQIGVDLAPFAGGSGAALVLFAHNCLAVGRPVIATIPSQWGTPVAQQAAGYTTHVVDFYGWGPSALRAMNPWIAPTPHDGDDSYWAARLCFGQVWAMSRIEASVAIDTTGLLAGDAAVAQQHHSGVAIPETYIGDKSVATLQDGTGLFWDGKTVQALAGAAPAFKLLLDDRAALLAQLTALKAQLAAAQNKPAPADPIKDKALAALQDLKSALASL